MEEIYNILMSEIEPELMTGMIPMLDDLYIEETPEEKKERGERYARAFILFQERFQDFCGAWKQSLLSIKHHYVQKKEGQDQQEDQYHMDELETSFGADD